MTKYDDQAAKFLADFGLSLSLARKGERRPPWADETFSHGKHYVVTIARHDGPSLSFDFWGSVADAQAGRHPSAYSVLACIGGDVHCPETFEEFCGEYGYDSDSRKAERTFRACLAFAKKLNDFFSAREIERLAEIC